MRIARNIKELNQYRSKIIDHKTTNLNNIGFVPTMGYLHEGHLSLIRLAKKDCRIVTSSIFVNPKQFAPHEDLARYPRKLNEDLTMLEKEGVDLVFVPENQEEMYPKHFRTFVDQERIDSITQEGTSRPGFFRGVCTVVTKLFNLIQPNKAYFGQKDGIQCLVIKRMVSDLNFPIEVVIGQTVRESDGLAMSSRNSYLSPEERKVATILYEALSSVKTSVNLQGRKTFYRMFSIAKTIIDRQIGVKLDYLSFCDMESGKDLVICTSKGIEPRITPEEEKEYKSIMLSGAIWVGKTRLIDNVIIEMNK